MMVNFDFLSNTINLDEDKTSVLYIENPKLFRNVYGAFVNDETETENIVFSENFVPFKTKGNVCVIDDLFRLSYSNTIMKKLYEQLEKYCNYELQKETIELKTHLVNFTEQLIEAFDYDFEFNYDISLLELFKALNIKPDTDTANELDVLRDFITLLNKYVPPKCFVLLNLHLYFTGEELDLFYKDIVNNHIKLLVIENKKTSSKSIYEKVVVFDNDLCEIIEN